MGVNKIIFVSTDSSDIHDEQTGAIAQKQLDAVTKHYFSPNDPNLPVAFRVEGGSPKAIANNISYLRSTYSKLLNASKSILVSLLSNNQDIHEIIECTKKGKTVVVGVTQQQLKTILTALQHNDNNDQDDYLDEYDIDHNYPVEDEHGQLYSEKIQNPKDIYVYTIFPYNKQDANFQAFPRSHYEELVRKTILQKEDNPEKKIDTYVQEICRIGKNKDIETIIHDVGDILKNCSYEEILAILQQIPKHFEREESVYHTANYMAETKILQSAIFQHIDFSKNIEDFFIYYPDKGNSSFNDGEVREYSDFTTSFDYLINLKNNNSGSLTNEEQKSLQEKIWDKLKNKAFIDIGCGSEPHIVATFGATVEASYYVGVDFFNLPPVEENLILPKYFTEKSGMKTRLIKDCFENVLHFLPKNISPILILSGLEFVDNFYKISDYLHKAQPGTIVIMNGRFGNTPGIETYLDNLSQYKKISIYPNEDLFFYEKMTIEEYENLKKEGTNVQEKPYETILNKKPGRY